MHSSQLAREVSSATPPINNQKMCYLMLPGTARNLLSRSVCTMVTMIYQPKKSVTALLLASCSSFKRFKEFLHLSLGHMPTRFKKHDTELILTVSTLARSFQDFPWNFHFWSKGYFYECIALCVDQLCWMFFAHKGLALKLFPRPVVQGLFQRFQLGLLLGRQLQPRKKSQWNFMTQLEEFKRVHGPNCP